MLHIRRRILMPKVDTIERTITVASPIAKVWEAITVADHLAKWFGDSADIDLRPGGTFKMGWSEYDNFSEAVVEIVDEPTTFAYRWDAGTSDDGTVWTTLVTFTLDESDGGTVITMVESGFSELPDDVYVKRLKSNTSGWDAELADLERHLTGVAA
jgi:uncharacterized protein YndB with AHSA1/START domain